MDSRKYSLPKSRWRMCVVFVTDWISSWVFHMGNQSAQRDFFPLLVNEHRLWYNMKLYWTLWGYSLYCFPLPKRGQRSGSTWCACSWQRFSISLMGSYALHESFHPASHTVCWRTYCLPSLPPCLPCHTGSRAPLPHLISWNNSNLLLCLPTVQFLEGAGGE